MKKYIVLILIFTMTGIVSCKKALEEKPYGFLSNGNFYKTEADANAALIYAYSILPDLGYYSRNFIVVNELPTEDVAEAPGKSADEQSLDQLQFTATNGLVGNVFLFPFVGIGRANAVIAYVPAINQISTENKNEIVGEALTLRALHYFNLVRLFGAVPLHLLPVTDPSQTNLPKSSIQAIYTQIIADLTTAQGEMNQIRHDGRVNQVGAWGLLAKVYLTMASAKASGSPGYEWVSDASAAYASAANWAGKVINNQSVYSLDPSLIHIYDVNSKSGTEHIFDAAVDRSGTTEGEYSKLPLFFYPALNFTLKPAPSKGTPDNEYIPGGFNEFLTEPGIYNSFDANDKRKTELIIDTIYNVGGGPGGTGPTQPLLITGSQYRPFSNKYNDSGWITGQATGANTAILRYSDVLLIYAEALGSTAEGYKAINAIRNRAGLGNLVPGLSDVAFRSAVVQERSWELAFEGNRLFDLRRTNQMKSVLIDTYGKPAPADLNSLYFFPIPSTELQTNPNFNQ